MGAAKDRSACIRLAQALCSEQHDARTDRDGASRRDIQKLWAALGHERHRTFWRKKARRALARTYALGWSLVRLLTARERDMLQAIRERAIVFRATHGKAAPLSAELDRIELLALLEKLGLT